MGVQFRISNDDFYFNQPVVFNNIPCSILFTYPMRVLMMTSLWCNHDDVILTIICHIRFCMLEIQMTNYKCLSPKATKKTYKKILENKIWKKLKIVSAIRDSSSLSQKKEMFKNHEITWRCMDDHRGCTYANEAHSWWNNIYTGISNTHGIH